MKTAALTLLALAVVLTGYAADAPPQQGSTQQVATLTSLVDPVLVNTQVDSGRITTLLEPGVNAGLGSVNLTGQTAGVGAPTGRLGAPGPGPFTAPTSGSLTQTQATATAIQPTNTQAATQSTQPADSGQTATPPHATGTGITPEGSATPSAQPTATSTNAVPPQTKR